MDDTAITVEGLGKRYRLGRKQESYKTLRDTLSRTFTAPFLRLWSPVANQHGHNGNTIWALKDLSFELNRGEVIGIIGRNGAGKSTLLKILSRITEPTEGYADVHGSVSSLLEVGIGFHGELSGRENVYLNGAILGMKRSEITQNFDEIVAFAEIEKFIDTPVKWYSSGMYLRLAFAVAAHLQSEILIVDEVLAVGDAQFQSKCLGKMDQISRGGRTILFVSHNLAAVQNLCSRVMWVQDGSIVEDGQPGQVISNYLKTATTSIAERFWDNPTDAPGDEAIRLHSIRLIPQDTTVELMNTRTALMIEIEYSNFKPNTELDLTLVVHNHEGICVFSSNSAGEHAWQGKPLRTGSFRTICLIPGNILNGGLYRISLIVTKEHSTLVHRENDALVFEMKDDMINRNGWYGKWPGVIRPKLYWSTEPLETIPKRFMQV
jgi:ABC-type polysaccharide/polyol phosphate transport system, ATPase component